MRLSHKNLEIVAETGTIPNVPVLQIKNYILGKDYSLNLIYTGPKKAFELNNTYRKKDYIPNILSFPLSDDEGEIYICRSIARKQYKDFDLSYNDYLVLLVVHGILHLKGHEHSSKMEELEDELTKKFTKEKRK